MKKNFFVQCLQHKQKQCLKAESWRTVKRKKSTKQSIRLRRQVKVGTILYSFNHCQQWKIFHNSSNGFGTW